MSDDLRAVVDAVGPDRVADTQDRLRKTAAAARLASDPAAVLYAALADVLDDPGQGPARLIAVCEALQAVHPDGTTEVMQALLDPDEETADQLHEELAYEVGRAELERAATIRGLVDRAGDHLPPEWGAH